MSEKKIEKSLHRDGSRGRSRGGSSEAASGRREGADEDSPAGLLLRWFDAVRRDLPWRSRGDDPYAVLVSEVMLQQTRVEVVERYYEPFLSRFPTLAALAAASEDEVLAAWSGLGYYRRARMLHRAARAVVERGGWPTTAAGLMELPGVGVYTAAAVASIAFGEAVPALDGNAERVLARRLALAEDPRRKRGRDRLLAAANRLLDRRRPGDSNQALMELGATVCRPRSPRCERCPLAAGCAARRAGETDRYPRRAPRRPRVAVRWVLALVRCEGRILLSRRQLGRELSGGLWSLPAIELTADDGEPDRRELAARFAERHGGEWRVIAERARARHAVTHRDIELVVLEARWSGAGLSAVDDEVRFATLGQLPGLPTTAVLSKALAAAAVGAPE